MARIICDNSDDIKHVQRDVFRRVQSHAEYVPCSSIPTLDLSFWKECCDGKGIVFVIKSNVISVLKFDLFIFMLYNAF